MNLTILASLAAAAALSAAPALAQNTAAAPAAQPAETTAPAAALSVETTPIETIAANPEGKAAMEKVLPGITSHPAYDQFKAFTLSQIQPMSEGAVSTDHLKAIQAELDKINK
ncbi:hypothetical protein [Phenylobacterium sp. J367]|uniref:hypothetical protein n=1 Tax=Phenylobacterium sp. J367 TaxID=2898435 RepID=UPI00215105A7|nr:hypothetical protein [Phenylobacterium sp. J367]MCR5880687.1 hypothetical protein [Phenylobacterium sp. J367]